MIPKDCFRCETKNNRAMIAKTIIKEEMVKDFKRAIVNMRKQIDVLYDLVEEMEAKP